MVWYSTLPIPETQAWSALFTKKYGIKVSLFRTGATGVTQKLQTEIPAGRWGFDIVMNRVTNIELYRKKNWLQKLNYPERDRFIDGFIDPDDYWGTYYMQYWVISYNTKLVKPNEVPKNYDEILSPRWKGMTTFDRVPARRDVPIKNKRLERMLQRKLVPVDLAIAEKYAEYNHEFLSLLGLKN